MTNKNDLIRPSPKLGDQAKSVDQHGQLDDKYVPDDKNSFIDSVSSIVNDLSDIDYKELFKIIKQKVEAMRDNDKAGLREIRKIIRKEITSLLEAEVKKIDLKSKMRDVLNMSADEFEQEYGTVQGADYALENFEDFKKWLRKQSDLESDVGGGVDLKSAIRTFKDLPGLKKDFERDMRDGGDFGGSKKDYNKGAMSLKELGEMLKSQGIDVNSSNPSSVRNYLGRQIDIPIIKKAMERTGKKYQIDLIKLVFDPGFTSWLSSQYKVHHEDKQKDWEVFLYNTVGKKLHKEITSGELERFNNPESKNKINSALHEYMKTDSELRGLFDKEYAEYYEEVDPDEFDSQEFLTNWFLSDVNDNRSENELVLNGAYETIVDMIEEGGFSSKHKETFDHEESEESEQLEEPEESEEENISKQIYESLKRKRLILK